MAGLIVIDLVAGVLLVVVGIALWRERRPDDPGYTPKHNARAVRDELQRAVNESHRRLRRSPAPWSQPSKRHVT
jgi:uncharacterized iron-regulated membrane protein